VPFPKPFFGKLGKVAVVQSSHYLRASKVA
jgi:hypothetical protein